METPEELKARLLCLVTDKRADHWDEIQIGYTNLHLQIEQVYQLARIAGSLEKIEKEGIFNYPRDLELPQ